MRILQLRISRGIFWIFRVCRNGYDFITYLKSKEKELNNMVKYLTIKRFTIMHFTIRHFTIKYLIILP